MRKTTSRTKSVAAPAKRKRVRTHLNLRSFRRVLKIIVDSEHYIAEHADAKPVFYYLDWIRGLSCMSPEQIVEHPCGTQACIGGWGCLLAGADQKLSAEKFNSICFDDNIGFNMAWEFFGMRIEKVEKSTEGTYLFLGQWHRKRMQAPTADVIKKLENIIATGKIRNPRFDNKYLKQAEPA